MLPEIWSATDIIFVHFGLCFALLPHYWHRKLKFEKNVKNTLNEDHMMYQKSWPYMLYCPWYPWDWAIILPFPPPPPFFLPSFLIAQTSFKGLKMVKNNWKLSFHFLHFRKRWDTAVSDLTLQKADLKSICWIFQEFSIFHTLALRPMKLEKFYSCF